MRTRVLAATVAALVLVTSAVAADGTQRSFQTQIPDEPSRPATERAGEVRAPTMDGWTIGSLWVFGMAILLLTGGTLWFEFKVMDRTGKGWDDWNSFRVVAITLIIGIGGFLIVAGYSNNQMGSFFGLMGSIVGFLFGRAAGQKEGRKPTEEPALPATPPSPPAP